MVFFSPLFTKYSMAFLQEKSLYYRIRIMLDRVRIMLDNHSTVVLPGTKQASVLKLSTELVDKKRNSWDIRIPMTLFKKNC